MKLISSKTTPVVMGSVIAGAVFMTSLSGCSNKGHTDTELATESSYSLSDTTGELRAEGASSQQKAMEIFGVGYSTLVPGATLSYNATGSGAGQKQFIAGQVDFGGTDTPLNDEQAKDAATRCQGNDAWHLPMVIGPVAIAFNVEGIDRINLSTATIARVFSGDITHWNDPEIAQENPGVSLPDLQIRVLYRAEESGTSATFQEFLHAAQPDLWNTTGKNFPTTVGAGAQGSSGVIGQVSAINGAITYVESGFAKSAGVGIADIDFGAGPVALNQDTVGAALDAVQYKGEGNNLVIDSKELFGTHLPGAYPLVLTTYELVCSAGYTPETAHRVKDFMHTVLDNQNEYITDAGYVPLSGKFKEKIVDAVDALRTDEAVKN